MTINSNTIHDERRAEALAECRRLADHLARKPEGSALTLAERQAFADVMRDVQAHVTGEARDDGPLEFAAADDGADPRLSRLRQTLAHAKTDRGRMIAELRQRGGERTPEDDQAVRAADEDIETITARIGEIEEENNRLEHAQRAAARTGVYGKRGGGEYRDGHALTEGQSVAGFAEARGLATAEERDLSLRKCLRGIVLGEWDDAEQERRAMSGASVSAGGHLLPTILSSEIIDLARNRTAVLRAGARLFPMSARTVDVARWEGDPQVAWRAENATIPASDGTLGKITLVARPLAGLTVVSRELLEDAAEVDDQLRDAFAATVALTVDRVALYGSGVAPEPLGVKTTAGILTVPAFGGANGSTPTNHDLLVDAKGTLADNNEAATAAIYSPRTARVFGKLKDTTNQPLALPDYLDGLARFDTNQIPNDLTVGTSADCSDVIVGDFRQLYVGVRTQLQLSVLTERFADTGQVGILAWFRGDVAVARPKAFHVTSGVRG